MNKLDDISKQMAIALRKAYCKFYWQAGHSANMSSHWEARKATEEIQVVLTKYKELNDEG